MVDFNYEGLSLEKVPYYEKNRFWVSPMNYLPETYDMSEVQPQVQIHDVTLRDGEQTPEVVFKSDERIAIAQALSDLGVDRIEFGMPIVSQDVYDSFKEVLKMDLKSEIVAFMRTHPDDVQAAVDLGVKRIIMEHNVNPYFCKHAYGLTHQETIERIITAFKTAQQAGLKASFMGWDASRTHLGYLKRLYTEVCNQVVPESIIFVDTFGVMTPWSMMHTIKSIREWFPGMKVEVHNHNGFGLGTANALAAVLAGASCVHGALLGLGERDGNIPIDEIAMALEILLKIKTNINLSQLNRVVKLAQRISGFKNQGTKSVTGDFYFQIHPGIAIHAIEKAREAGLGDRVWAAFAPEVIGKKGYEYLLGKESGLSTVKVYMKRLGLDANEEQTKEMLRAVKKQANIVKGTLSLQEFEHIARNILHKDG
jgi:isopropylmalate/homocitrate/citramalate synthase